MTKKILIVEDELISAYNLSEDLQELGYKISGIVKTGEAAIAAVKKNIPDLILMDIKLKGEMSGIETVKKLKQEYDIPIIYLTAFSDEKILELAEATYPEGYLIKPAKLEDIKSTIKIALKKHKKNQEIIKILATEKNLNKMQCHFVAMLAHEMRNQLTTISLSTEILENKDQLINSSQKIKYAQKIRTSLARINEQIEDLMNFEKIISDALDIQPKPINIKKFCASIIETFEDRLSEQHQLNLHIENDVNPVNLDPDLLEYIFNNLINNAIKYSPDGGIIEFKVIVEPEQIIFIIEDQGIGMSPEFIEKVGQPFMRGNNVNKIKGTGIGLYIVKQAVAKHQGKMEIESTLGKGTKFTLTFPNFIVK